MTTITLTSELEAVNIMLDCIGEAPVSSLATSGLEDVAKARATLDEVSREVQQSGWHFNSEEDYPLIRDGSGNITVPTNTLQIKETYRSSDIDIALRGQRVYDRKGHTYVFTKDLTVDIVFLLDWEELPQPARNYIAIRAARRFQTRSFGSESKHKFSQEDEQAAWVNLQDTEGETAGHNILTGSYSVYQIIER